MLLLLPNRCDLLFIIYYFIIFIYYFYFFLHKNIGLTFLTLQPSIRDIILLTTLFFLPIIVRKIRINRRKE